MSPEPDNVHPNNVDVTMTEEQIEELRSDARHYATEHSAMGPEFFGLGMSARATLRALGPSS